MVSAIFRTVGAGGSKPNLGVTFRGNRRTGSVLCVVLSCTYRFRVVDAVPPLLKPQLFSVGAFSRPIAIVPACLCGFLRKPADLACCLGGPVEATFRSLLAILLSGHTLRRRPEVRKSTNRHRYKSMGYARTVQTVRLRHCLPKCLSRIAAGGQE